jgi:flagellar motor switch protein FliM
MMDSPFDARDLSQGEIDSLLAKLASGDVESDTPAPESNWRVVKTYDFRRPDKLSKDQMRTLQLLHETFGRVASSSISAYLRSAVQMNLVSIAQGVYGEYVDQLPADTVLYILTFDPLPGNVLIGIDLVSAMAAVDRLLGGLGAVPESPQTPTEIELALVQTLVGSMLKGMKDAWGRVTELTPLVRDVVLDPRFVQVALKTDPVVVVAFEMTIFHHSGTVTLCLPYVVLEPVLGKLTAQQWFASGSRGTNLLLDQLRLNLDAVSLDIRVELGAASATLSEMGSLKEGDVLLLDRSIDQPLDILVGGRPKFAARPGMMGNKLAVQIVGRHDGLDSVWKNG